MADFSDADRLLDYGARVLTAALVNAACFALLGALVAAVPKPASKWFGHLGNMLTSALLAWAIGTLVLLCRYGWPHLVHALVPWLATLLGVWMIGLWRAKGWARWSLVLQVVGPSVACAALIYATFDDEPLPFEKPNVTSADKRRLVALVRARETQQRPGGLVNVVQFDERDVELLANWGLQVADGPQSKSQIRLRDDRFQADLSLRLPGEQTRFLNVQTQGAFGVEQGELTLQLRRLRVGHVEVPSLLLPLIAVSIDSYIDSEDELAALLERVALIRIEGDQLAVELDKGAFRGQILPDLELVEPPVRRAILAQIRRLDELFSADASPPSLEDCVRASFTLAAQRTAAGAGNAADENRAALYALGIVLGHPRLGEVLLDEDFDETAYRIAVLNVGRIPLRGRRDLTRHFVVSAALSSYANEKLSDAAGLLKEELDAGAGGSGFSFADLMADRAGTRFAVAATEDEASARQMQRRLAGAWDLDDLFPADIDLPEGLRDNDLQDLGGIGGERYEAIIADIEDRLDRCRLLR